MEKLTMSVCPPCTACPEVGVHGETVKIGETGNGVVLTKDEWNVLVNLIASGQLGRL